MTTLTTPFLECHKRAGAKLVEFAGFLLPISYEGILAEHRTVRTGAGVFDVSHMGEFEVRGPDAGRFVDHLVTNRVANVEVGQAVYTPMCLPDGGIVDDLLAYKFEDRIMLVVNAANIEGDWAWVQERAQGFDVRLENVSDRIAQLAVQGPRAAEIFQDHVPSAALDLGYYRYTGATLWGVPMVFSRTGYTGEDGFELYVDPEAAVPLWKRLLESGAPHGLVPAGLGARDTLRLEAGMALYGHELDETTTPLEAGLDWVVKLDKGDFIGSTALREQQHDGVPRKLVGFEVTGRGIAREGHAVTHDGSRVGQVTSGTWSPTFEKALGMAYVPAALGTPGTEVEIDVRGRTVPAQLAGIPFYRRNR